MYISYAVSHDNLKNNVIKILKFCIKSGRFEILYKISHYVLIIPLETGRYPFILIIITKGNKVNSSFKPLPLWLPSWCDGTTHDLKEGCTQIEPMHITFFGCIFLVFLFFSVKLHFSPFINRILLPCHG